ncbi:MAG TPA: molybdopterin-synthase adenylyltransferase MoeB [Thermoplasmata archaeon]|nr:molybdopterin-synthase adenylyltransferase MoeB [Thermoplasmata archaeon]
MHASDPAPVAGAAARPTDPRDERPLSPEEIRRYSRHLLLPEVGTRGQRRLRAGRVLLVGAGGLGSPAALYLAAAGIGTIGLVDEDRVSLSNLQRQVLYATRDIGEPKTGAAAERLRGLNPEVAVHEHPVALTSANAFEILSQYEVIVDGSDNFPTRYLVNDACALLGKADVYGSVYRFEGQVTVFDARQGPCYRCLFPEPPPPDAVPSCAEGGVLGVLPGLIGTLQALETIKILLGVGDPLYGRLLLADGLSAQFRELRVRKDPACVLCGPSATQRTLIDYPKFCGVTGPEGAGAGEITALALSEALRAADPPVLVDVRTPAEFELGHLPGATSIPSSELVERASDLSRARELVLYCSVGARSGRASRLLRDLGFTRVRHLHGGLAAWASDVDPTIAIP